MIWANNEGNNFIHNHGRKTGCDELTWGPRHRPARQPDFYNGPTKIRRLGVICIYMGFHHRNKWWGFLTSDSIKGMEIPNQAGNYQILKQNSAPRSWLFDPNCNCVFWRFHTGWSRVDTINGNKSIRGPQSFIFVKWNLPITLLLYYLSPLVFTIIHETHLVSAVCILLRLFYNYDLRCM